MNSLFKAVRMLVYIELWKMGMDGWTFYEVTCRITSLRKASLLVNTHAEKQKYGCT